MNTKNYEIKNQLLFLRLIKKNKSVLVKGPDFEKEFESITDTIKYFESIGIKLDRKYLSIKLKSGGLYKGYNFYFNVFSSV